jgi:signal transduction histidine kinase
MGLRARMWPGLRTSSIWFEVAVALLGTVAIGVATVTPEGGSPALLLSGTALLFLTSVLLRRRAPLVPFLLASVLAAIAPALTVGVPIAAYAVGRYVPRWPVRTAAAILGSVAILHPWAPPTSLNELVSLIAGAAILVVLSGGMGVYVRTRAELLAALRDRAERAEAEQTLMAREAVVTERTRIAREMHDAVGHRVSLMVLQAGAIEMAAADRYRVEQLARQVQDAGRAALEELRQMVGVLRAGEGDEQAPLGPQEGLPDLPRLVARAREAGMDVEFAGPPAESAPVDAGVGRAAYRVVQESLTNSSKHAPGAPVRVAVERFPDALVVRVVNGAPSRAPGAPAGGGYGLVGLGERVRTLGGRLTAEPRLDGGFLVEAVLPT